MKNLLLKILFWSPRLLGLAFALGLSVFALDVFEMGYGFWETLGALLLHLIPNFIVLALVALAWRWEKFGGSVFIFLGLIYLLSTQGRIPGWSYLVITLPLVVMGALFIADYLVRKANIPARFSPDDEFTLDGLKRH
jgi:hypothetical protein